MSTKTRVRRFVDVFGRDPEVTAEAPGRVNLIGEHTDYNGGFVLPTVIPYYTRIELAHRDDDLVRAWSANIADEPSQDPADAEPVSFRLGAEARRGSWIDYVQGVTAAMRTRGLDLPHGFDVRIDSTIPLGSGLSSSAALLVALVRGVRTAFAVDIDDVDVANVAHRAETSLVGAPVGIMDQAVCSLGRPGYALLIDTFNMSTDQIPIPPELDLVVIDSGIRHAHASGEYATRRRECDEAKELLGVPLRQVESGPTWQAYLAERLPPTLQRRVRHVVTEDLRVLGMMHALPKGDFEECGRILRDGHASLRDDFEVSTPEIDVLVEVTAAQAGVFGARMTGGGFGGSIVAMASAGAGRRAAELAAAEYGRRTGRQATVVVPAPVD